MATLHDSSLGDADASGTTLSAADTLAVTAGDIVIVGGSCEGANGVTFSFDTGASTPTFTEGNVLRDCTTGSGAGDLHGTTHYWIADTTGNLTVRMLLSAARTFRHLRAYSFTPTASYTFELDAVAAAEGDSLSPSAGSASASTIGATIVYFPFYASHTFTAGSGWTEPAEFSGSVAAHSEYKLHSAGSQTGDATIGSGSNQVWMAQMAIFKEVATTPQNVLSWIRA